MKGYYTNVFFTFLILKSGNMQPHSGGHTGGAVVEQVDRFGSAIPKVHYPETG